MINACTSFTSFKCNTACKQRVANIVFVALMAILALTGLFIILTSQGINLGRFNTFGHMGVISGSIIMAMGCIPILVMIIKTTFPYINKNVTKKIKTKNIPTLPATISESKLESSIGSTHFKGANEMECTLFFQEGATCGEIMQVLREKLSCNLENITFIVNGKEINTSENQKETWGQFCQTKSINFTFEGASTVTVAKKNKS